MPKKLRIVLAQLDFVVGDIAGNLKKHIAAATTARDELKADIIVFPELSITGYPPEDLLQRPAFIEAANLAVNELKSAVPDIYCVVGYPHAASNGLLNMCSVLHNDTVIARYAKQHLPNYGVFDEKRYFVPGNTHSVINVNGVCIGLAICEDVWFNPPVQQAAMQGARIVISPNASPFETNKHERRKDMLTKRSKTNDVAIVYVNCVGGQDDLVFDGGSMVVDTNGKICQHAGFFNETLVPVDFEITSGSTEVSKKEFTLPTNEEKIYQALVMGVRDYVQKNKFPGALIGLSGGIDSALTLAIAVDALGKDKVTAVMMPSRYTSAMSLEDAETIANNFGVAYHNISIEPIFTSALSSLANILNDKMGDITAQNIQSRARCMLLMALSNESGKIVLTTGNRSELAVGYATLYGDMAGGFCVLKDIPKTLVYRLANYRNRDGLVIPQRIIDRAPSAELAFDQTDQDSLPAYDVLDAILEHYLNLEESVEEIIGLGFDPVAVKKVVRLVNINEYKRKQSPLGPRINHTAFGKDRRYPNTSSFDK